MKVNNRDSMINITLDRVDVISNEKKYLKDQLKYKIELKCKRRAPLVLQHF